MSKAGAQQGPALFEGYQLTIYEWVFFGITTPLVATRLYVQFRFRHRPWREIFVIVAWLLYLADTVGNTLLSHYHWFEPLSDDYFTASNPYITSVLKINLLSMLTFKMSIYMCKFALLCFYLDLNPRRTCTWTWWLIAGTFYFCIMGAVSQVFFTLFLCKPLNHWWGLETYTCADVDWFYVFSWALFLFTDVLVYIIPFLIIHNLTVLEHRQKRAAYWMFAFGLINIVSACIMLTCYIVPGFQHSDEHSNRILSAIYDFDMPFQQGTAIIITCLPQVRRFALGMSQEKMRRQMAEKMGKTVDDDLENGLMKGNTREVGVRNSGLTVVTPSMSAEVQAPREPERVVIA